MGTEKHVKWKSEQRIESAIKELSNQGYFIIALETVDEEHCSNIYEYKVPKPCAIILGNERYGISEETLKLADKIVYLPMNGTKNSLNVGVAYGITVFEIRRQWSLDS